MNALPDDIRQVEHLNLKPISLGGCSFCFHWFFFSFIPLYLIDFIFTLPFCKAPKDRWEARVLLLLFVLKNLCFGSIFIVPVFSLFGGTHVATRMTESTCSFSFSDWPRNLEKTNKSLSRALLKEQLSQQNVLNVNMMCGFSQEKT